MADISSFSLQGGRSGRYYENYSENYSRAAFRQHASTSNIILISLTYSSNDERDLSNYGRDIPTTGKNLKILPQLETWNERKRSAKVGKFKVKGWEISLESKPIQHQKPHVIKMNSFEDRAMDTEVGSMLKEGTIRAIVKMD